MQRAFLVAVELHEHQIPNLDVAIAVGIGAAGRAAGNMRAVIVENFRTRAARTGVAHLPKVIALIRFAAGLIGQAHDALLRHADVVGPVVIGFIVGVVNRDPELILR